MGAAEQLALGVRLNLMGEIGQSLGAQRVHDLLGRLRPRLIQRRFDGTLAHGAGVGEPHAIGGEQAGERVDQNRAHAQRIGHEAGVLAARAAETLQGVVGHVIAALHGDFLDGVGHVLDGDADEAFRHFFGRAGVASLRCERRKALPHGVHIEGLVAAGAEDLGEEGGVQLAHHHIGVCDRQRAAAPIAARAWISASGIGADDKATRIRMEDRAAARRHRMDEHHGRANAHARDFGFKRALEFAVVMGDIRGGAAHVEADDPRQAREFGGLHTADDPACGAGQNGVAALEQVGVGQPARGHHEHELGAGASIVEFGGHPVHIAAQHGGEIGVCHGRVAAPHELHQRAHLMGGRNLLEADLAGDARHGLLVGGVAIGMHEGDGAGLDAGVTGRLQVAAHLIEIGREFDGAIGQHALGHFHHALVELLGLLDVEGENVGAGLVADAQGVGEAARGHIKGALALALQQGVGGHRRAHLDGGDSGGGDLLACGQPHMVANALHGGVRIGLRVLGKQLAGGQRPVRQARDHIREGAAPVDPEIPLSRHIRAIHAQVVTHVACHFWKTPIVRGLANRGIQASIEMDVRFSWDRSNAGCRVC